MIQRYTHTMGADRLEEYPSGAWVKYADHLAELAAKDQDIKDLEQDYKSCCTGRERRDRELAAKDREIERLGKELLLLSDVTNRVYKEIESLKTQLAALQSQIEPK